MLKDIILIILSILVIALGVCVFYIMKKTRRTISDNERLIKEAKEIGEEAIREARAKTEFVANMSHEIRVPMNAIACATELLTKEDLPPATKSYLNVLKNSSDSLLEMVNGILDFSKMDEGKMSLIESKYCVRDVLDDVKSILASKLKSKSVAFTIDITPSLPAYLLGDSVRIKQILLNLLTNSVKYTRRGNVSLDIGFKPLPDDEIDLLITVSDTGCGITPQAKEKLRRMFEDDKSRVFPTDGAGMGLSVVKQLTTLMSGKVSVESELSKGTTFKVNLHQKLTDCKEPVCDESISRNLSIDAVIWEDNVYYRDNISRILATIGIPSKTVEHAAELAGVLSSVKVDYIFTTEFHFEDVVSVINKISSSTIPVKLVEMDEPADTSFDGNFATVKRPADIFEIFDVLHAKEYRDMHTADHSGRLLVPDCKVLVVDDNRVNLKVAKALLETFSAKVTAVDTGFEAVELVRMGERYDLILMDHLMPGMDGIEAANRIWEIQGNSKTPVIALTANAGGEVEKLFFESGMSDFIPKPIVIKHLNYVLQKWLPKEKQIFSEQVSSQNRFLRMHSKAFQPEWGLSKVWDDKKIFIGLLKVYLDKNEILLNEIKSSKDLKAAVMAAKELENLALSAGTARLPELLDELISIGNTGELAVFRARISGIEEENASVCEEIEAYLEKEDTDSISFDFDF